mgnify:CR=1 FL=1
MSDYVIIPIGGINMKEFEKYMTIGITDGEQCGVNISPNMDCATALQLLGTLALHTANAFNLVAVNEITKSGLPQGEMEAAAKGTKESIYDALDMVFSNVLANFYPDAPKSELEDEAILQLTNELIEKRYNALPKKEREAFKKHYQMQKLRMTFTLHDTPKATHETKPSSSE